MRVSLTEKSTYTFNWNYENVLSDNMSTLTRILLRSVPLIRPTNPKVTSRDRRKGKKRERKKKLSSLMFLYRRLQRLFLNDKRLLPRESCSLASRDRQRERSQRKEVTSFVFMNPGTYIYIYFKLPLSFRYI